MSKALMPVAAVITVLASASMAPCLAQSAGLPQTIWSKSVQTPGDNQYGNQTQNFRHGAPAPPPVQAPVAQSGGGGGGGYSRPAWHPYPRPARPDPSIEAIAADEPVTPAGFPPLPDRLELPVALGWSGGAGVYGGGGRGYGSGAAPGMAGGGGGGHAGPQAQGMHQHYQHYDPGAFIPGGQSAPASQPQEHHSGYYKVGTPEQFSGSAAAPAADNGAPKYSGAGRGNLRALGKEPKLNAKNDSASQPDAPTPVVVNQAVTQDLSLPEDEFSTKQQTNKNGPGKKLGRALGQGLRQGMSAGMGAGMGMMHF